MAGLDIIPLGRQCSVNNMSTPAASQSTSQEKVNGAVTEAEILRI